MTTPHVFQLNSTHSLEKAEGGERVKASKANFPILKGMSLYKLTLYSQSVREPHWHPNADELGYCLSGQVMVMFYHNYDVRQAFLVQAGEMFFIPSGALHCIANVAAENAELLSQFSNEDPEEFELPGSIDMFSNAVLGNTWGVQSIALSKLVRPLRNRFAVLTKTLESIPESARYVNPYRYGVEASQPLLVHSGGSARMAKQNLWPILKRQSLYSLRLESDGMREPHWHPETAELGYVHTGQGRMSVQSPDGQIDTYLLKPGDLYFIPEAYPHHIENMNRESLHFLIFFNQSMPQDIGFTASINSFSNNILSATLGTDAAFPEELKKYYKDLFIVDKINPVDP